MFLLPYDACNSSLVEQVGLNGVGKRRSEILSQSSVWPKVMLDQVETQEKMKNNFQASTPTPRAKHP
jgi:hypothetical protein